MKGEICLELYGGLCCLENEIISINKLWFSVQESRISQMRVIT